MRALKSNAVLCLCALIGLLSNLSSGPSFAGAVAPLALHQNYAVGADGTVELNLKSYDLDGDKVSGTRYVDVTCALVPLFFSLALYPIPLGPSLREKRGRRGGTRGTNSPTLFSSPGPHPATSTSNPYLHPPLHPPPLQLTAKIITLPSTGTLSLLTPNYLTHSILPKTVPTLSITSSMLPYVLPSSSLNRVLYTSSSPKSSLSNPEGACPSFTYTVSDATSTSLPGTVRLLPSSDLVVYSSTFSRDGQQWSVSQSGSASAPASLRAPKAATYEASQRGALNHYVYGNDESVNGGFKTTTVDPTGLKALDGDLWAFQSPKSAGVGQLFNAAYGGTLSFTVSSFSGDFSDGSRHDAGGREHLLPLVTLKCPQCKNGKGTTIVFPLSKIGRAHV